MDEVVKAWVANDLTLIKSLTDEYIKKVNSIVVEGISNGETNDSIMRRMMATNKNMTKSRASLIARDQVGKLNGRLIKRRNQESGLNLYEWLTAMDERVREKHKKLNHKICRWDNDNVYANSIDDAKDGNWRNRGATRYVGIPGSDVQCRCGSISIVVQLNQEIDKEIDEEIEEERVAEGRSKKKTIPVGSPTKGPTVKASKSIKDPTLRKAPVFDNIQDAEDWATKNLIKKGGDVRYRGMDVDVANEFNDISKGLIDKYGYKYDTIQTHKSSFSFMDVTVLKDGKIRHGSMRLNRNSMATSKRLKKTLDNSSSSRLVLNDTFRGSVTHEYGHLTAGVKGKFEKIVRDQFEKVFRVYFPEEYLRDLNLKYTEMNIDLDLSKEKEKIKFVGYKVNFCNPGRFRIYDGKMRFDGYAEFAINGKLIKIAFEYNGIQHYEFPNFWFGDSTDGFQSWLKYIERDQIKKEICKLNNIYLIEIPYYIDRALEHPEKIRSYIINQFELITGIKLY